MKRATTIFFTLIDYYRNHFDTKFGHCEKIKHLCYYLQLMQYDPMHSMLIDISDIFQ